MEITIFDGTDSIGGNKIYLGHEKHGIFLDFGMNYKKYGEYYEEFLKDRTTRGIHDQIILGLVPHLNIYRRDMIPSDLDTSSFLNLNVDAVLISHAHMDHCANISFIDENIPVWGSSITLAIIKAMRDTSAQSPEIAYFSPRKRSEDSRILESDKKDSYKGRNFISTENIGDDLRNFICTKPGANDKRAKSYEPGTLECIEKVSHPFEIRAFPVDHSIYGATAYSVSNGDTTVVYTGDIRLHGALKDKTESFIEEANSLSPDVLIIEGTRTLRDDEYVSEDDVYENCLSVAQNEEKLVIADFSPRNFERLDTFMEIAEKTSRELVVTAKDAYLLHALECTDDECRLKNLKIYRELKGKKDKWESEVIEKFYGGNYLDPEKIKSGLESYILCFSFLDMKHLLDIKPTSGTYIYSSSEAFNEEQKVEFWRLNNWLDFFNINVAGFEIVGGVPQFKKGYHASGHASSSELIKIIDGINPEIVIPVHTENTKFFLENLDYKVIVPEKGKTIKV